MDIKHLEYFIEIARYKSFSKAAEQIPVSQPSLSKAIKDLEHHLGAVLFYRSTKFVELTDSGEAILEQANQIVSSFRNMECQLKGLSELMSGKIRIGLPPITGITAFAHLFGAFKTEYPNISIQLFEFGSKKITQGLQDGSLDIGVICIPAAEADEFDIIAGPRDPLCIVMHPANPLNAASALTFADLRQEAFVLYNSDFLLHEHILDCARTAGFKLNIICETMQRELMLQLVADNFGIALLPSRICHELDSEKFAVRPLTQPQLHLQLGIAWKKQRYLSHAAKALLSFICDNQHSIHNA